jgi:uncharacterized repeat protein (TIGR01451 family)
MRRHRLTHPSRAALLAVGAALLVAGLLSAADRAAAAFPGGNGQIAYTCVTGASENVCVVNEDGSGQAQLTSTGHAFEPAWSPDGSLIAFVCNGGVCVMDADGSDQKLLTSFGYSPAWSPDGTRIVFACGGICVMNADGSDRTQLTSGLDDYPSWSPDGTTIAFERFADTGGGFGGSDIYVMNADGSGQTRLTDGGASFLNEAPDWSPDGTKIAFETTRDGRGEIYVMNPDGSDVTRVTFSGGNEFPAWSPDGTKIAFDGGASVADSTIHVMDADGSGVTDVTGAEAFTPDWQPLTGTPTPFSDLALRMAGPRRIGPGDPITYVIRVRNAGPSSAEDVVVRDPLPSGTTFLRATTRRGSCQAPDPASATLRCSLGSMGDGSVRTIIIVVRAPDAEATITNTASVAASTSDPTPDNNTTRVVTVVR